MPRLHYTLCDVFTERALTGNQLAVIEGADLLSDGELQAVGREFNFSEVTFVLPPDGLPADARVRIFTPVAEIPFAGHPLLGTAVILVGARELRDVELATGVGVIAIEVKPRDGHSSVAWMRQPVPNVVGFPYEDALFSALGVSGSELPVELYDNGMAHVFVALPNAGAVARLEPDFAALVRFAHDVGINACVNCFAPDGARWKTRMFAPADGLPEDPATGSAAGPLACHLARHARIEWGEEIEISQGTEIGRPSTLHAVARGAAGRPEDVRVGGGVVVVGSGELVW